MLYTVAPCKEIPRQVVSSRFSALGDEGRSPSSKPWLVPYGHWACIFPLLIIFQICLLIAFQLLGTYVSISSTKLVEFSSIHSKGTFKYKFMNFKNFLYKQQKGYYNVDFGKLQIIFIYY